MTMTKAQLARLTRGRKGDSLPPPSWTVEPSITITPEGSLVAGVAVLTAHRPSGLTPPDALVVGPFFQYDDGTAVSGAVGDDYATVPSDELRRVRCRWQVVANGHSVYATSAYVGPFEADVVTPDGPILTTAPSIPFPGVFQVGVPLTVTGGVYANGVTIVSRQLYVSDTGSSGDAMIVPGSTGLNPTPQAAHEGRYLATLETVERNGIPLATWSNWVGPIAAAAGPGEQIPMTMTDQVVYEGRTYYFNEPAPWGYFASGRPFTWTSATLQLVDTDPPFEMVLAPDYQQEKPAVTISGQSYASGGLMVDPKMPIYNQRRTPRVDNSYKQGIDGLLGTNAVNGSSSTSVHEYDPALNKHPTAINPATGLPNGPLALDRPMAVVGATRIPGLTGPPTAPTYSGWNYFESFSAFYVIDPQDVPVGSLAPPISGPDKIVRYKLSDADRNVLPGGGLPAEMPSLATVTAEGYFDRGVQPFFMQSGEWMRRYIINTKLGAFNGYSRDVGLVWSDWMAALLSEGPTAPDADVARALQFGIDLFGGYDSGFRGLQGAGQSNGYIQFMYLTAAMLHGVDDTLLAKALDTWSNATHQMSWANASLIGAAVPFKANHDHNHVVYSDRHVTTPPRAVWKHTGTGVWPNTPTIYDNADQDADYETSSAGVALFPEVLNIGRMLLPWLGMTLARFINGGSATWDAPTERSAMFAYVDRLLTYVRDHTGADLPNPVFSDSGNSTVTPRHRKYWDYIRDALGIARYKSVPDAGTPNNQTGYNRTPNFLWPIAGGFQWDMRYLGNDGGLPITDQRISYSIDDGRSWHLCDTQALTGKQLGRPPIKHWIKWERQNALGWGPPTVNTKRKEDAANFERLAVTPLGAHVGTTVNTVPPKLVVAKYPRAWGPWYADAPSVMDLSETATLLGSVGDWEGDLSSGFAIKHYRNGVEIPGEINPPYVLTPADLGTIHRHSVTAGGVTVFSDPVEIAARPALAAGVVCDITGLASDDLYYAEILDSFRQHSTSIARRFVPKAAMSGTFTVGETVTSPEGGVGIVRVKPTATLLVVEESSPFLAGQVVTGASSGASFTIGIINPGVVIDTSLYFKLDGDESFYVGQGALLGYKSSSFPTLRGNIAARVPLVPGETYSGTAYIGIGLGGDANQNTLFRLGSVIDGQQYLAQQTIPTTGQPVIVEVPIPPFVAIGTECWAWLRTNTNTGQASGGNPAFDRIVLNKIS